MMKNPNDEKIRRQRGRRAKRRANLPLQPDLSGPVDFPEPPLLPDVYTKDRRSIHPARKQKLGPPPKKGAAAGNDRRD